MTRKTTLKRGVPDGCYHQRPDHIRIAFDDHRLVANAGLVLPLTLAHRLGLGELVGNHVDLGDAGGLISWAKRACTSTWPMTGTENRWTSAG